MIESPVIHRCKAEAVHHVILAVLKNRFKTVARDIIKQLSAIQNEKKLTALCVLASACTDMDACRKALAS